MVVKSMVRSALWCVTWACMLACASTPPAPDQPPAGTGQTSTAVLTWTREGGFAGFCDELKVTGGGDATASSCRGGAAKTRKLTSDELGRLNAWREGFGAVSIVSSDGGVADSMTIRVVMTGSGRAQPTEAQRAEIFDWAQRVFAATRG